MCSLRFRSDSGLRDKGAVGPCGVFSIVLFQYLQTVSTWWWPVHPFLFFAPCLVRQRIHVQLSVYARLKCRDSFRREGGPQIPRSLLDSSEISPRHYIHVPLVSGSHSSVAVSPEEYRMSGFSER